MTLWTENTYFQTVFGLAEPSLSRNPYLVLFLHKMEHVFFAFDQNIMGPKSWSSSNDLLSAIKDMQICQDEWGFCGGGADMSD